MSMYDLLEWKLKYKPATRISLKIQIGLVLVALYLEDTWGSTYLLLCWLVFTVESSWLYFGLNSQNHRFTEWLGLIGPLDIIQPNFPDKAGCTQDQIKLGFEYLQRRLHSFSGHPIPVFCHPQSKEVCPHIQIELPCLKHVPCASYPVAVHLWGESGPIFFMHFW